MTPMVMAALLAAAVVIGIVAIVVAKARDRRRMAHKRTVAPACVGNGHAYRLFDTGWRCATCGNYVPRIEGEAYGLANDGLRERRREDRSADDR